MIHQFVIAALVAAQATAAPERCLTRQEAGDIALNATSIGLGALVERCRPHVGADAFLNTGATAMLARLRAAAEPRSASAFAAFARMSRPATPAADAEDDAETDIDVDAEVEGAETPEASEGEDEGMAFDFTANPEAMAGIVTVMAAAMINSIDVAACPDANDLVESLSPLPPESIARMAGAGLGIAGTARPDSTDNPLCPA